jgi:hypothetical protein
MQTSLTVLLTAALFGGALAAQEPKPVPKDSTRVSVPGCTKGYIFTAGPRTQDEPGSLVIPEGMHLRMNGPKKVIDEVKAHEGSMIEITGLMKKGQFVPDGVSVGGGVRISPGTGPTGGGPSGIPSESQTMIDLESWRPIVGQCPSR